MKQSVSSASTSINKNKLPAIFGKLSETIRDCALLDYGCGKYTELQREWAAARNIDYLPYDPYNQPEYVNFHSMAIVFKARMEKRRVIVICSNVLNVIDSDEAVWNVIRECRALADLFYVTVYEGDGTGTGRYTGKDSYQRNAKLRDYLRFFPHHSRIEKGVLTCLGSKYDAPVIRYDTTFTPGK